MFLPLFVCVRQWVSVCVWGLALSPVSFGLVVGIISLFFFLLLSPSLLLVSLSPSCGFPPPSLLASLPSPSPSSLPPTLSPRFLWVMNSKSFSRSSCSDERGEISLFLCVFYLAFHLCPRFALCSHPLCTAVIQFPVMMIHHLGWMCYKSYKRCNAPTCCSTVSSVVCKRHTFRRRWFSRPTVDLVLSLKSRSRTQTKFKNNH